MQVNHCQEQGLPIFAGEPDEPNDIIVRLIHPDMGEIFYHKEKEMFYYIETIKTPEEVERGVSELMAKLENEVEGKDISVFTIGKGGKTFSRRVDFERLNPKNLVEDYIPASSYSGQDQEEEINLNGYEFKKEMIEGRHIFLVDGVYDTGKTFAKIVEEMVKHNPLSISSCLLMSKAPKNSSITTTSEERGVDNELCVFYISKDDWVCGEGPDFDQWHREITGGGVGRVIWLDGEEDELSSLLTEI